MKLHIKSKLMSIHDKMQILDEQDKIMYEVESKALSIKDKTYIKKADGTDIAYIHAKMISLHNTYFAEMTNGKAFELNEELWHLTKDIIHIDEFGWQLEGDFLAHNYEITDRHGDIIATARRKWISLHNIYYLDIMAENLMDEIVTVFIVLEHMIRKREEAVARTNHSQPNN